MFIAASVIPARRFLGTSDHRNGRTPWKSGNGPGGRDAAAGPVDIRRVPLRKRTATDNTRVVQGNPWCSEIPCRVWTESSNRGELAQHANGEELLARQAGLLSLVRPGVLC